MEFVRKYFDPEAKGGEPADDGSVTFRAGPAPGDVYVYRPEVVLALNVALATRRPLLISGDPGSGKSTLARNAAAVLGWRYYKHMITSRTQASDLLSTFDTLRRLNDANAGGDRLRSDRHYVVPGTLWWAFDPVSARTRGHVSGAEVARVPLTPEPASIVHESEPIVVHDDELELQASRAVVLLDEIDKADPDVPNDLLEAFDLRAFTVPETGDRIEAPPDAELLLILTTNGERELPPAFMRRCVTLELNIPDKQQVDWFVTIALRREPHLEEALVREIATELVRLRDHAGEKVSRQPGTGEFLDAVAACRELGVRTGTDVWRLVQQSVLWKREDPLPAPSQVLAEDRAGA